MTKEVWSKSKPVLIYSAALSAATGNNFGFSIDTAGYRAFTFATRWPNETPTAVVEEIRFQESNDSGVADPWTDVADSEFLYTPGSLTVQSELTTNLFVYGCVAKKRWMRVAVNITSGEVILSQMYGLLQDPAVIPENLKASIAVDVVSPGDVGDTESTPPKREV